VPKVLHREMGNYLTPDDVDDGAIIQIIGAGEYKDTKFRKDRLELPVVPHKPDKWATGGNAKKTWGTNKTSEVHLFKGFKTETTDEWVNRLVSIEKAKQMISGEWQQVLYGESVEGKAPPPAAPQTQPRATPPAEGETPTYTEAETRYLRYHELLIGTVLDPQDWQNIPKAVKAGLQAKGVLIDQDGYPFLTEDARKALE